ncbi:hypothetical protein NB311A_09636 [Nitrobacter sp. Nb-311A]|nr:hypothetical protein NB311A_09636 [Nitrobacter sp. Nb-311A]
MSAKAHRIFEFMLLAKVNHFLEVGFVENKAF